MLTCVALAKAAHNLLRNLLGAEEKELILSRLSNVINKSNEVSATLESSVDELSKITNNTAFANEKMSSKALKVSESFESTIKYIENC
jgi:hypothetical protein